MNIRCIIVDDEQPARDELRYLLSRHADIEVVGEADSAGRAVALIRRMIPDLVFLDIQMPGRNGFEVIAELAEQPELPQFVFATAYDNYAVQAFEASAVDYILKPVSDLRLEQTLERVRKLASDSKATASGFDDKLQELLTRMTPAKEVVRVPVEKNGRIKLLLPEEIVYCSCEDNRILVHTGNSALPLHGIATLDRLAEHLAGGSFFRAHRSVLVNLDCIREFSPWFNGKYNLIMNDASRSELCVSRSRVKAFKHHLGI